VSLSGGGALRLATAAGNLLARELGRAGIAEICLLGTTPGIAERDAQNRTATLFDFLAAVVTHENCLTGHDLPPGN
jgi:hypothetical protein